jgi:general secretion pathway protein N
MRWALAGLLTGAAIVLVAFAPASWLASSIAGATGGRLLLADARGTVWRGSAVVALTGGPGSRDASALPGRLRWVLSLDGAALALQATQACCINGALRLRLVPGLGRARLELAAAAPPASRLIGQWPASWLVGLGTPWNTLRPSGAMRLSSPGLSVELVQGRWRFTGQAELALVGIGSRLSTLDPLGSYRLSLQGDAASGDAAALQLSTSRGPLQLSGSGQWAASRLRFTGQASADKGSEAALVGLMSIIGRRQGAVSVISIG